MRTYTIQTDNPDDIALLENADDIVTAMAKVDDILRSVVKHMDVSEQVEERLTQCRTIIREVSHV